MNPISERWELDGPLELAGNTSATRVGRADPTTFWRDGKLWRAAYFHGEPAVTAIWDVGRGLYASAWGPGAAAALAAVPALVGLTDDPAGFDPSPHPVVAEIARARPGLRIGRTGDLFHIAVPTVLAQKVTGIEAKTSYQALVRKVGVPAPLPRVSRRPLFMPPTPQETLRALAGHGATSLGIDIKRTGALREVALVAHRLREFESLPPSRASELRDFVEAIPGCGVWTANLMSNVALGDPDAVPVGDYHIKNFVAFALAGEPRGTDDRMLELLEPFRPHRARALRCALLSGKRPPAYGPRVTLPTHVPLIGDRAPSRGAAGPYRRSGTRRRTP